MPKANSRKQIKFITEDVFHKFGVPEYLLSDNGKQFTGKDFKEYMEAFEVTLTRTGLYAPQANASERVNQSILE